MASARVLRSASAVSPLTERKSGNGIVVSARLPAGRNSGQLGKEVRAGIAVRTRQ